MALGFGVIGCGGIAERRTIPEGIMPASGVELVGVMDIDEGVAKKVGAKYGVPGYSDVKAMLAREEVGAVYIASPPAAHCEQTALAAESGKHVLCEKPMAMTIAECEKMIEACERNGVLLGIGFMMRFHGAHRKMKQMVEEGCIGQPVMGRAQLSCWYPEIAGAWRQDAALSGGGSLVDMGNHCIDLLEVFLGKVREVSCFVERLTFSYAVEDTAMAMVRFESGALGVVDNCFNIPDASSKNVLELYGTRGSIMARGTIGQGAGGEVVAYLSEQAGYEARQVRGDVEAGMRVEFEPVDTYRAEIEHFATSVENGRKPLVAGEDGLWSQRVTLACYESARCVRAVRLG